MRSGTASRRVDRFDFLSFRAIRPVRRRRITFLPVTESTAMSDLFDAPRAGAPRAGVVEGEGWDVPGSGSGDEVSVGVLGGLDETGARVVAWAPADGGGLSPRRPAADEPDDEDADDDDDDDDDDEDEDDDEDDDLDEDEDLDDLDDEEDE